ncbi:hypothetical protein [Actinoplanes sp. M2I2]|uniref:hypothetical protein n=1 Tax=Actinoplanes sp. M2I2 TaxID=1734444 RepID=UPI00202213BC|nr:hypothetical protein [Actinoplanes sp. M2I2]
MVIPPSAVVPTTTQPWQPADLKRLTRLVSPGRPAVTNDIPMRSRQFPSGVASLSRVTIVSV